MKKAKHYMTLIFIVLCAPMISCVRGGHDKKLVRQYNAAYQGVYLNQVGFPIGGIGAGMICLEGSGALSHVSVRNKLEYFNEPLTFSAISVKGYKAKVLEGQVPARKIFGVPGAANGLRKGCLGLPRFAEAVFRARFPFAEVDLSDPGFPLHVTVLGWSPFIPGNADDSSLPVGGIEYRFENPTQLIQEAVFSFNTKNFMETKPNNGSSVLGIENGFVLCQEGSREAPWDEGAFAVFTDDGQTVIDHSWFKGGWWDALTLVWENIERGRAIANPPSGGPVPGASLYVPLKIRPGEQETIRLMFAWFVPKTNLRTGEDAGPSPAKGEPYVCADFYEPWYAGRFSDIHQISDYWRIQYDRLKEETHWFTEAFYDTDLPPEVVEAVSANLTILKSPTVLRQKDGRLWNFEGCYDTGGCCPGSCTHVWNYAQAFAHLFPRLERSLRETEFGESQDSTGHQTFRANLPIRPVAHTFYAASDGQLGGIMKVYRDWRISGDSSWLAALWPSVKKSLEYCIETWDPRHIGVLEEPHHNTYDIEYWGPEGHCTSFYLGALAAAAKIGKALNDDVTFYEELLAKGRNYLETELYDGEYFFQQVKTSGLNAQFRPIDYSSNGPGYKYLIDALNQEGPKYQYGHGCLSDGVLGFWMAQMCGLGEIVDANKVKSNLRAIYKYNLKRDLSEHANPQRPGYALGREGGLLLCTWPKGDRMLLPFVYSDEVWTGVEYQVASHLMLEGIVDEGLDIVRVCRDRYDGRIRNPFDEYECGHWYGRALSSYGLLQGLTGIRYDAIDRELIVDSRVGDNFRVFISTETGFGTAGLKDGVPFLEVRMGKIPVAKMTHIHDETKLHRP